MDLDVISLNLLIHIALVAEIGALFAIAAAGVVVAGLWVRDNVIQPWSEKRELNRERRDVAAHPERDDLAAIIIRGQEKFRQKPPAPPMRSEWHW